MGSRFWGKKLCRVVHGEVDAAAVADAGAAVGGDVVAFYVQAVIGVIATVAAAVAVSAAAFCGDCGGGRGGGAEVVDAFYCWCC